MFRGSFIKRAVFSNILILAVPFIALSLLLSSNSYYNLRQNALENKRLTLSISDNFVNSKAEQLSKIVANINYGRTFSSITSGESLSYFETISSSLQAMMMGHGFDYIYLYFMGEQNLYSDSVSYSLSFFSSDLCNYTFLYKDSFYDYLNSIHKPLIAKAYRVNRNQSVNYITFFFPIYSGSEQNGVIFFLISEDKLNLIDEEQESEYLLLDKGNRIISRSKSLSEADSLKTVELFKENKYNGQNIRLNGTNYLLIYSNSNNNYFNYVLLIPPGKAYEKVMQNIVFYLIAIAVLALVGGLLIYLLTRYNYKPIRALMNKSQKIVPTQNNNEIDIISQTIDFLQNNNQVLQYRVKSYSQHLMTMLLNDPKSNEQIFKENITSVGTKFEKSYFQVFAVQDMEFKGNNNELEIAPLEIEKSTIYYVDTFNGYMIFIANTDSKKGIAQNQIKVILKEFKRLGFNSPKLCLLFGKTYGNIGDISKSYFEAMISAKYKVMGQIGNMLVVYFENIPNSFLERLNEEYAKASSGPAKSKKIVSEELNIKNLIQYIDEYLFSHAFSLQVVAEHFNVHISYLSQYFSTCKGETINDYVTRHRINKAKDLLINTNYSVVIISEMTGYLNENSFIRRFKQICNLTPGEFRRQNAAITNNKPAQD